MAGPDVSHDEPEDGKPSKAEAEDKKPSLWKRLCTRKWLGTVISLTIVAHVTLIAYQGVRGAKLPTRHGEISLGHFSFTNPADGGRVASAEFKLHIRLLRELEKSVTVRLFQRKFKVEQDIEELLRQASGGDFDDPMLTELKRQIQEKINQSLEIRAISEVIITDLVLTKRSNPIAEDPPETGAFSLENIMTPLENPAVPPEKAAVPPENAGTEPEKKEGVGTAEWKEKAPS